MLSRAQPLARIAAHLETIRLDEANHREEGGLSGELGPGLVRRSYESDNRSHGQRRLEIKQAYVGSAQLGS